MSGVPLPGDMDLMAIFHAMRSCDLELRAGFSQLFSVPIPLKTPLLSSGASATVGFDRLP